MQNDQENLIENLKQKKFREVWEEVKYIGYQDVPNIEDRYIIFYKAVNHFNPYQNNNFILFYKKHLKHKDIDRFETFYLTTHKRVIADLKREFISPTLRSSRRKPKVDELKKWKNTLGDNNV